MTIRHGYALVKLSDNSVVQTWDINVAPPSDFTVAEAQLAVHGVTANDVGSTFGGAYKLVERQLDDQGPPTWKQKYAPDAVTYDGTQVIVTRAVVDLSSDELVAAIPARKASMIASVLGLRATKLAAGFDYNFNDARGVHRIGTTEGDEVGWDKVSKLAFALMALGQTTATISIVTNTGPTTVTADEWQSVLIAGGQFGQPIYTQSFTLEAEIAAAATSADLDAIDINAGW